MASFVETQNEIKNYYSNLTADSVSSIQTDATRSTSTSTKALKTTIDIEQQRTVVGITNVQRKYSDTPNSAAAVSAEGTAVINRGVTAINKAHEDEALKFANFMKDFNRKLTALSANRGRRFANKKVAGFGGSQLASLLALINSEEGLMMGAINAVTTQLINTGVAALASILATGTAAITALTSLFTIPKFKIPGLPSGPNIGGVTKFKKIATDFQARDKGQSSTSNYIQANIPTAAGLPKVNPSALIKTPESMIMLPQLKLDTNNVNKMSLTSLIPPIPSPDLMGMAKNALSQISIPLPTLPNLPTIPSLESIMASVPNLSMVSGMVTSLIPKLLSSAIAEPKPTSAKAEYGKIVVKENKAGFVEIMDETPGNERKVSLHPTGSYDQKLANGDTTNKITGKQVFIVDKNWEVTVGQDAIIIVSGEERVEIRSNKTETIKGNSDLYIDGTKFTVAKKNVQDDFKKNYTMKIGNESHTDVGTKRVETVGADAEMNVGGNNLENITGGLTIMCGKNVNIIAGGSATLAATGLVRISGSKIMLG